MHHARGTENGCHRRCYVTHLAGVPVPAKVFHQRNDGWIYKIVGERDEGENKITNRIVNKHNDSLTIRRIL